VTGKHTNSQNSTEDNVFGGLCLQLKNTWMASHEFMGKMGGASTWASAPEETKTLRALENANPVILFWCPFSLLLTCQASKKLPQVQDS
jgi:hypothetical protein